MKTLLDFGVKDLFNKQQNLELLFNKYFNTKRIIKYFGNINSNIMILAESPVQNHLKSSSNSIFALDDETFNQSGHSGSVILRIFKDLNLDYRNFFFDNVFKLPIETLSIEEKINQLNLLIQEIKIISPKLIICLGENTYSYLNNLNLNYKIKKLQHPAYIIRKHFTNYNEYLNKWRVILDEYRS